MTDNHLSSGEPVWYTLFTLHRHEKSVCTNLLRNKITAYLPMQQQIHQWRDRRKKISVPLFPNYVFVNVIRNERFKVFDVPGIVRYLDSNANPSIISQSEIDLIQLLLNQNIQVVTENLKRGDSVMITSGVLKGLTGTLINRTGGRRIVVEISSLQKKISVDVSSFTIKKLEEIKPLSTYPA